jgi:MGT family glycosyltransferase
MKGRFLFVTFDGGGNMRQLYAIIRRLLGRGHQVTVFGQSTQADVTRELGAVFLPLTVPAWTPGKSVEEEMDVLGALCFGSAVGEAVVSYVGHHGPDAIVVDCMLTSGLAAAERSNIPSAAIVHFLYQQFVAGTTGLLWHSMLPTINETRHSLGVPPVDSPAALMHPLNRVLVTCPQEFDVAMPELPSNVHYIGALFDNDVPAAAGLSLWSTDNTRPRILVAFSTTYQHQEGVMRRLAAALAELPVEAIITVGPAVETETITPAPNVEVRRFIPHTWLLPNCSLVVTHAGLGTVMAALAHGVPLLCMPMGREQGDNAARVAAIGAGMVLPVEAQVAEIHATISAMLASTHYREAAQRMAAVMSQQDGVATAVKELEALLA